MGPGARRGEARPRARRSIGSSPKRTSTTRPSISTSIANTSAVSKPRSRIGTSKGRNGSASGLAVRHALVLQASDPRWAAAEFRDRANLTSSLNRASSKFHRRRESPRRRHRPARGRLAIHHSRLPRLCLAGPGAAPALGCNASRVILDDPQADAQLRSLEYRAPVEAVTCGSARLICQAATLARCSAVRILKQPARASR